MLASASFVLSGCFGASGGAAAIFSSKEEDNSAPQVKSLTVTSVPQRREHGPGARGGLVGLVLVEYVVADKEGDPVDLQLVVEFPDERTGDPIELRSGETLSERLGKPSDGVRALKTSRDGVTHRFVWNSDWDIDRWVNEGALSSLLVTEVAFRVSVKEAGSDRQSKELVHTDFVDNTLVHPVGGFVQEETSVTRGDATFDTLAAMDVGGGGSALYIVDSGTHQLWKTDLGTDGKVTLIAGNGNRRKEEEPLTDVIGEATLAMLQNPIDVSIDESEGKDIVYFLEEAGCLWRMEDGRIGLELDGREFLDVPKAFALEFLGEGRRFAYIADAGQCRILRYNLDTREAPKVILGEFTGLSLSSNAHRNCVDAESDNVIKEPAGLTVHRGEGRRVLFVSSTARNEIIRVDLGPEEDPDEILRERPRVDVVLRQRDAPELCRPTALRVIGNALYIVSRGTSFQEPGRAATGRGVVLKASLVEDDESGLPTLETQPKPERVCGGLEKSTGGDVDPKCMSGVALTSTYRPRDECQPANKVPLAEPTDVIEAQGRIYVCDSRNQRIRRIEISPEDCKTPPPDDGEESQRLTTFVGGSVEGRSADMFQSELCPSGESLAGSPALSFKLSEPLGMVLVDDECLLISDRGNNRIVRLDLRMGTMTTIAGRQRTADEIAKDTTFAGEDDPATEALFNVPRSIAIFPSKTARRLRPELRSFCESDGKIYIADSANHLVRKIDSQGIISTLAGSEGPEIDVRLRENTRADPRTVFLKFPRGVATDSMGRVLISDCRHRILIVDTAFDGDQMLRRAIGDEGEDESRFDEPCEDRRDGGGIRDGQDALAARLNQPSEMAFDPDEEFFYFADLRHFRVRRARYESEDGTFHDVETVAGRGDRNNDRIKPEPGQEALDFPLGGPLGVDLDPTGRFLFFSDVFGSNSVYRVDVNDKDLPIELIAGGNEEGSAGDGDIALNAEFANLNAIQVDREGKTMYVVDSRNHRVRRFFIDTR